VVPAAVSCAVQPPAVPALHLLLTTCRIPRAQPRLPAAAKQSSPSSALLLPALTLETVFVVVFRTDSIYCMLACSSRPIQPDPTPYPPTYPTRAQRETTTTHRSLAATSGYICSTSRHRAQHSCGGVCLCDSHTCKAVVLCARASHRSTLPASPRLASVECVTVLLVAATTDC
jgi:hypothetical protein